MVTAGSALSPWNEELGPDASLDDESREHRGVDSPGKKSLIPSTQNKSRGGRQQTRAVLCRG